MNGSTDLKGFHDTIKALNLECEPARAGRCLLCLGLVVGAPKVGYRSDVVRGVTGCHTAPGNTEMSNQMSVGLTASSSEWWHRETCY